jgi:5'-phosphate synthase pdxT subunit
MSNGFRGVGVLALQGGYNAHVKKLRGLGALIREVRTPADLVNLDGLVLPGGESTTMTLGIEREGLGKPIRDFIESGRPVLATCAGAILLDDAHMGLIDISCDRNAYGGQTHSFETEFDVKGVQGGAFRGLFIRAPHISRVGPRVDVLAEVNDHPVAIKSGSVTALTFHPELTSDDRIHRAFYESIPLGSLSEVSAASERPVLGGERDRYSINSERKRGIYG